MKLPYPTIELKSNLDFDNIRVGINGITRQTTGTLIHWYALQDYINDPDRLIDELKEALSYSDYIYTDEWKSYASSPTLYSLFPGLLNPDGRPGAWHFKGSDKKDHLTFLAQDPKTHDTVACTHYITYKAHKRLVREAILDIENLVKEQVQRGVSSGVEQAIAQGTATLKEIQTEKERLMEQLERVEKAEQYVKHREVIEAQREQERLARKANKTTVGYVYVLRQVGGTHYKIGHTSNPDKRKHTFDVKLPFAVEFDVLIKCDDRYQLERELHAKYASKRVDGEWFNLDHDDLEHLRGLQ